MNKNRLILISIMISQILVFASCGTPAKIVENTSVKTIKASKSTIAVNVEYSAKLKPIEEIAVSPKTFGKVESFSVDVGMRVNQGDELFRVDARDARAQYAQATASYESAKANLARTTDYSNLQLLYQTETLLGTAQTAFDDAKRNYDKVYESYQAMMVSKQEMDDATTRYTNANLQLQNATKNLDILKNSGLSNNKQAALAQLEQAKASLEVANIALANTIITSPITGEVSARNIDTGEMVSNSGPAYVLINSNVLVAEISVPATVVKKISKGQKVNVDVGTENILNLNGIVDSISPNSDPKSQAYAVKVNIDNADGKMRAGMFSKVILEYEKKENIVVVPNRAIVNLSSTQFVYAFEAGKVKKIAVKTGVSDLTNTEIVEGIAEGKDLIIEGQSFLSDGQLVNAVAQ